MYRADSGYGLSGDMALQLSSNGTPSISRRMGAWCYEVILVGSLVAVSAVIITGIFGAFSLPLPKKLMQVLLFCILCSYFVYFWTKCCTLPMKTWRLKITDSRNEPLHMGRAILRYFLCWFWVLPPLVTADLLHWNLITALKTTAIWIPLWAMLACLRKDRQFLHDALAGTKIQLLTIDDSIHSPRR